MENPVEEIKNKIDIVEFIGNFITLKKSGRNFKAICPFHQEKTPSFIVSPERQIWHCFGACGEGGDVIKFLMKWENITFFEALRELADKVGVRLKKVSFEDKVWKKKERLISMNLLAAEYFQYILDKTHFGKRALDYLSGRKINQKIIKKFQLGYAPNSWDSLIKFLVRKRYEIIEMLEAGLLVKGEKGSYYDRFRGRLIFPIKDTRGNVVGFSGRVLDPQVQEAKYINTPETPIYHKRETLYGIHLAKEAIKRDKDVILVEGEFDVITPYQQGIENIVAIKGTAVTKEQLMLIKRYTDKVTLALDTDEAGIEAIKRGILEAELLDLDMGIVSFDYAKDPDEAVQKDVKKFKKIVAKPMPIYDFLIEINQKKYAGDDPFNKKKFTDEMTPYILMIKNPIVYSHYVRQLAKLLNVSESSIELLIKRAKHKKKRSYLIKPTTNLRNNLLREVIIQKYLSSLIFQNDDPYRILEKVMNILEPLDFSIISYQKIYQLLLKFKANKHRKFDLNDFVSQLPHELKAVFDELYLFASNELGLENEQMERLCYEIKRYSLKREIGDILAKGEEYGEAQKNRLSLLNQSLKEVENLIVKL